MKVVVISIPHTGTRWTLRLLQGWGLGLGPEEAQGAHVTKPGWRELMASADKVVVPLRDRALSEAGVRRHQQVPCGDTEWATLMSLGERGDVFYLPIPPTEDGIVGLANFLGVDIGPVDWSPLGDDPKTLNAERVA